MSTSQTASRDDRSPARSTGLAADMAAPGRAYDLSVIIPTRNEAGNIRPLLDRLGDALSGIAAEVLVMDDSDDAPPGIARRIPARSAWSWTPISSTHRNCSGCC